ncbi:MAG: hypothetical protein ACRDWN_06860 [Acidimicrobiales bacterium]
MTIKHRSMAPEACAREMLRLWLEEMEALESARISHGAIRQKFAAAAQTRHDHRDGLWRAADAEDSQQVFLSLCEIVSRLLDELTVVDPAHRPPQEWLAQIAPDADLSPDGPGMSPPY